MKIVGSYLSPYVRKVLACLAIKGVEYEIDPIPPFFGNDEFERLSPLRQIPLLIDGDFVLRDSSVICAYVDEAYDGPALYPLDVRARAQARWLEEYADTRMANVFVWGMFYQRHIHPALWGTPGDEALFEQSLSVDMPAVLDYLESELPDCGFLFGEIGAADVSIAAHFRNAAFLGIRVDSQKWPRTAAFVDRVLAHPSVAGLHKFEVLQFEASSGSRRQAMLDAGAPLSKESFFAARPPRWGVMRQGLKKGS